jgi:hypothetical protein
VLAYFAAPVSYVRKMFIILVRDVTQSIYLFNSQRIFLIIPHSGNPYRRGRLSTVNLLIRLACFVKKINIFSVLKAPDLN